VRLAETQVSIISNAKEDMPKIVEKPLF